MANIDIPWDKLKVRPVPEKKKEEAQPAPLREWTPTDPTEPPAPPEVSLSETTHKCPKCGNDVSDERTELLGVVTCAACTPQAEKPLGVMDYSGKTGGTLMITTDKKLFKILKKPINQQR